MKRIYILVIAFAMLSCGSDPLGVVSEPEYVTLELNEEMLSLERVNVDVLFFNAYPGSTRFMGIMNDQEMEIPVQLDLEFELPENSYGYRNNIDNVTIINERYDLIEGFIVKFVSDQNFRIDDTIYTVQGFSEQTSGDYLLFDKQTFKFIELEEGFSINGTINNSIQVYDNKLYYLKRIIGVDETAIKFLDLNDSSLTPQLYHSDNRISSFLFNENMDLTYVINPVNYRYRKYLNHDTGNIMDESETGFALSSHFIGLDGEFYAQGIWGTVPPTPYGYYKIDVNSNSLTATELFFFDDNDYPEYSHLGSPAAVIPNQLRDIYLVISNRPGLNPSNIYEFDANIGTITPLDLSILGTPYVIDYYNNDFFIIVEFLDSNDIRIKKFNLSGYNEVVNDEIGDRENGVVIDKNNGTLYYLSTVNEVTKFVEISSDNVVSSYEFSEMLIGYFSIIN